MNILLKQREKEKKMHIEAVLRIRQEAILEEENRRKQDLVKRTNNDEALETEERAATSRLMKRMSSSLSMDDVVAVLHNFNGNN